MRRVHGRSWVVACGAICVLILSAGCPPSTPPEADFGGYPVSGYDPLSVDFTDQSVAGSEAITAWAWTFGDGGTSAEQNPEHVYTTPGVYPVTLTVTTGAGSDTVTQANYITVNDADVDVLIVRKSDDEAAAEDIATVLEDRGLTSRIFWRHNYTTLAVVDLSRAGMIILCSDTHDLESDELTLLRDSGKGLLAIGNGGHIAFANMGLGFGGAGHVASSDHSEIVVEAADHAVFTSPNDMGVAVGEEVNLFQAATAVHGTGVYLPDLPDAAAITVLAYSVAGVSYSPLLCEGDLYLWWGYSDQFDRLSVPGVDLFENCVRYLMD